MDNIQVGKIYLIINLINGKKYVGQTRQEVSRRWTEHKRDARHPRADYNSLLHQAMRKYGIENFTCETIEEGIPLSELNDREKYWIEFHKSFVDYGKGYNLTTGGNQNTIVSEETREKHRINALTGVTGHRHLPRELVYTEEVRKRMGEANKGRKMSPEQLEKLTERMRANPTFKGKHHSEETKQYLREIFSKENRPAEITEKCVNALKKYYETHPHCFLGKKGKDSSRHKEVFQYDENYNLLNHFYSRREAMVHLGIKTHDGLVKALKRHSLYKNCYWFNEAVETIENEVNKV